MSVIVPWFISSYRKANQASNEVSPHNDQKDQLKKSTAITFAEDMERRKPSDNLGGNINGTLLRFFKTLRIKVPSYPEIPDLGIDQEENKNFKTHLYPNDHGSTRYNSKHKEAT